MHCPVMCRSVKTGDITFLCKNIAHFLSFCADIPIPFRVRAEVIADNTSIRVSWEWLCQGELDLVRIHYQPEGGSLMNYTVGNTTEITSVTLSNLQCNTKYTIWVHVSGDPHNSRSLPRMVNLPARGMCLLICCITCHTVTVFVLPKPLLLPLESLLRT